MTEKKDLMTRDSRYRDAFLAVLLDPSAWNLSVDEVRTSVYQWMRKYEGKDRASKPGISTYYRVIRHPDFQAELAKSRSALVRKAMPSIEHKLVSMIMEDGDLKSYDRLKKAIGEENVSPGGIEFYGHSEAQMTDKNVETVLSRMAKARETRPDKKKSKPKAAKRKKKKK